MREVAPFHDVFQQSSVAQALVALDLTITHVNEEALRLSGLRAQDLVGQPLLDRVPEGRRERAAALLADLIAGATGCLTVERQLLRHDGALRDVLISVRGIAGELGRVDQLSVAVQDITELRSQQRAAERDRARWKSLSQNASDVALILGRDLVAQYASPSLQGLLGRDPSDVVGTSLLEYVHPQDRDQVATALLELATGDARELTSTYRLRSCKGAWRNVEQRAVNLLDDRTVAGLVLNLTDVTAQHELERTLQEAMLHDRLTGLPNRALTMNRLVQCVGRTGDQAGAVTLVLVDLDRFTAINGAYGHSTGDRVLRWAADTLRAMVDPDATLGRYGPDQFAVLLPSAGEGQGEELGQRVTSALNDVMLLDDGTAVRVSACVGVAHSDTLSSEALVSAAENALSRAKLRGRAQCVVHEPAFGYGLGGRSLGADLAAAVRAGELVVHYQPVVHLRTGVIGGFEALVRWPHPQLGLVPPDTFLPIAEALDLHVDIDLWVLREACVTARLWVTGEPSTTIAVNVSPATLLSRRFVADVRETLTHSGLPPTALVLEVTETAVVTDLALAARVLGELRELGVTVSIDDFGTGYSSMLQLRQLPFTKLKIDREFVRALPDSTDDLAICASVISLAVRLGVSSIGEGVETPQQAAALSSIGCQYGQGYLWSPAVDGPTAWLLLQDSPWTRLDMTPDGGDPEAAPGLTTDPALVRRAQELRDRGDSLHTIAAHLNAEGHRTLSGRQWRARTVARLVFDAESSG